MFEVFDALFTISEDGLMPESLTFVLEDELVLLVALFQSLGEFGFELFDGAVGGVEVPVEGHPVTGDVIHTRRVTLMDLLHLLDLGLVLVIGVLQVVVFRCRCWPSYDSCPEGD